MENKESLSKNELNELTPLEVKKYKTRTMLNEILNSKNVIRSSVSPWDTMKQFSYIKDIVKLDGHKTIEENEYEEESEGVTSVQSLKKSASIRKATAVFLTKPDDTIDKMSED